MKKRSFTAAVIFILTTILVGCANVDGEGPSSSASCVSGSTSNVVSSTAGNSSTVPSIPGETVNSTDSTQLFPAKCKVYKSKAKSFTEEQLLSLFTETPERTFHENSNTTVFSSESQNGNTNGKSISFSTKSGRLYNNVRYSSVEINGGLPYEKDLDFASSGQIIERAKRQLDELGVSSNILEVEELTALTKEDVDAYKDSLFQDLENNSYSLDETDIQKEKEKAESQKKIPSRDFYYIEFKPVLDDIRAYSGGVLVYGSDMKYNAKGTTLCMIYSEKGLEMLHVSYLMDYASSSVEEAELTNTQDPAKLIQKKYDGIIFDGVVEVQNVELIYISVPQNDLGDSNNNFETRPFYAFHCKQSENYNGEIVTTSIITYFDAVTGNEFATEQVAS